jgi:hypothetical protein
MSGRSQRPRPVTFSILCRIFLLALIGLVTSIPMIILVNLLVLLIFLSQRVRASCFNKIEKQRGSLFYKERGREF